MSTNSLCVGGCGFGSAIGPCYLPPAGFGYVGYTTESQQQMTVRSSITFSNFGVNASSGIGTSPFHFRIGGINGNQSFSILNGVSGWASDATHSDSVSSGNLVDFSYGTGGVTTNVRTTAAQQNAASQLGLYGMGAANNVPGNTFSVSAIFVNILGSTTSVDTSWDDASKSRMAVSGTLANMGMNIISGSAGTVTAHFYTGSNGNQALSVASGTGFFQDTTHSDAITAATDCSTTYVSTNASGTWTMISYEFSGTSSSHDMGASYEGGLGGGAGNYYSFAGSTNQFNVTESNMAVTQPFGMTTSLMRARSLAGGTPTTTMNFRKNGANGNQIVTFSGSGGLIEDVTHSDALSANDTFDFLNSSSTNIASVMLNGNDGSIAGGTAKSMGGMY